MWSSVFELAKQVAGKATTGFIIGFGGSFVQSGFGPENYEVALKIAIFAGVYGAINQLYEFAKQKQAGTASKPKTFFDYLKL